jgi:dTDP-glucose 4,6-dehydratase
MNRLKDDLDHILKHTEGLWDELRGKRIFITGGTGFFGCWLLESFAWANDKLNLEASALVLTRNVELLRKKAPHLTENPAISFHIGDVRSFDYPSGEFSYIVHAATAASDRQNDEAPLEMLDTIIEGTRRVLDFAVQCGAKKLLLTSSGAVYGKQPLHMTHIPEDYMGGPDTMDPQSAYAEGKRVSELLCAIYSKKFGIECKIARGFAFVGPYFPLDIHYAIGNFIRDALNGGPIVIKGDGAPYRSYLYAADLAIWLWTILFRGQSLRPYHVGSEEEVSVAQLAYLVADCFKPPVTVNISCKPQANNEPIYYVPSTEYTNLELNLCRRFNLKTALSKTISYYHETCQI